MIRWRLQRGNACTILVVERESDKLGYQTAVYSRRQARETLAYLRVLVERIVPEASNHSKTYDPVETAEYEGLK